MINVILTADYELFLGKNLQSYDKVLFDPTLQIIDRLEKYNISLNIFPDICSVWRHRDYDIYDYVEKFESQLIEAIKRGHDVQLHLHPHWLKSTYDGKDWFHDQRFFKLQDYGFNDNSEINAKKFLRDGKNYLESLLTKYSQEYKCIAFRAGGYCLQPDESLLIQALLDTGIKIDSSIIPNMVLKTNVNLINFRVVPDVPNWFINPKDGLKKQSEQGLFEIPIPSSTRLLPKLNAIMRKYIDKEDKILNKPRGYVIQNSSQADKSFWGRNIKRMKYITQAIGSLECERMDSKRGLDYMLSIFNSWVKRYNSYDDIYLSIIMHPKSIFQNHLDNLMEFIDRISKTSELGFITFTEAYEMLFSGQGER